MKIYGMSIGKFINVSIRVGLYHILDNIAGMLQDLARWFHKLSIKVL